MTSRLIEGLLASVTDDDTSEIYGKSLPTLTRELADGNPKVAHRGGVKEADVPRIAWGRPTGFGHADSRLTGALATRSPVRRPA